MFGDLGRFCGLCITRRSAYIPKQRDGEHSNPLEADSPAFSVRELVTDPLGWAVL